MSRIYGVVHQPLVARFDRNRRDTSKTVAFIGRQLCFLERGSIVPQPGEEREVMITRAVYGKHPQGHKWAGGIDHGSLRGLMVEVVDPARHTLVAIDGFECSGTMCSTTASGRETDGTRTFTGEDVWTGMSQRRTGGGPRTITVTPGRTDIREAFNVNKRYGETPNPCHPTNVWVERALAEERGYCLVRIAGLTRIEDGTWARLVRTEVPKAA